MKSCLYQIRTNVIKLSGIISRYCPQLLCLPAFPRKIDMICIKVGFLSNLQFTHDAWNICTDLDLNVTFFAQIPYMKFTQFCKVYNFGAHMLRIIYKCHTNNLPNLTRVIPLFYLLLPFTSKIIPAKPSVWRTVQQLWPMKFHKSSIKSKLYYTKQNNYHTRYLS